MIPVRTHTFHHSWSIS